MRTPVIARLADDASRQRGSGTILVLAIVTATLAFTGLLIPVAGVSIARHRAAVAADAAALAAADVRIGIAGGEPCDRAAELAAANGATLSRCMPDGFVVTVRVGVATPLGTVAADASAGPPG